MRDSTVSVEWHLPPTSKEPSGIRWVVRVLDGFGRMVELTVVWRAIDVADVFTCGDRLGADFDGGYR